MNQPITGPALDDLTAQWLDGRIPAESYVRQARRLARESARRDISKWDDRRNDGEAAINGAARPHD